MSGSSSSDPASVVPAIIQLLFSEIPEPVPNQAVQDLVAEDRSASFASLPCSLDHDHLAQGNARLLCAKCSASFCGHSSEILRRPPCECHSEQLQMSFGGCFYTLRLSYCLGISKSPFTSYALLRPPSIGQAPSPNPVPVPGFCICGRRVYSVSGEAYCSVACKIRSLKTPAYAARCRFTRQVAVLQAWSRFAGRLSFSGEADVGSPGPKWLDSLIQMARRKELPASATFCCECEMARPCKGGGGCPGAEVKIFQVRDRYAGLVYLLKADDLRAVDLDVTGVQVQPAPTAAVRVCSPRYLVHGGPYACVCGSVLRGYFCSVACKKICVEYPLSARREVSSRFLQLRGISVELPRAGGFDLNKPPPAEEVIRRQAPLRSSGQQIVNRPVHAAFLEDLRHTSSLYAQRNRARAAAAKMNEAAQKMMASSGRHTMKPPLHQTRKTVWMK